MGDDTLPYPNPVQFDKALQSYVSSGRSKFYPIPTPPDIVSTGYTVAQVGAVQAVSRNWKASGVMSMWNSTSSTLASRDRVASDGS